MPMGYTFSKQREALEALKDYKEADRKLKTMIHRKEMGLTYSASWLARLEESLKQNPVKDLIDEGVFQSIVEDTDTSNLDSKTNLGKKVKSVTESLLPATAISIGKQAYVTEDTGMFQFMLKATQYSDFVARYAMYHYMIDEKGVDQQKALNQVIETFIDYDVPSNKYLVWMNDMGLVMFTKFFLRIQRVIARTAKSNPAQVIAGIGLQTMLGDISDIMDSGLIDTNIGSKLHINPLSLDYVGHVITPSLPEMVYDALK